MRLKSVLAALFLSGSLFTGAAQAASLEISPVLVTLAPGQTAAIIEVQNRGDAPAAVQARAYDWAQAGDTDLLTPTQGIILSPPIFTIPAGASQTVRLLLRGMGGTGEEHTYRLLLDEVPPANTRNRSIVIALRVSIPVIATSASSTPAALQWHAERGPDGKVSLTALNTGRSYDRVSTITVTLANGARPKVVPVGTNPYVLPGARRRWTVQDRPTGAMRLNVTDQSGASDQTLVP